MAEKVTKPDEIVEYKSYIKVRVIQIINGAKTSLIEWVSGDKVYRGYIPSNKIKDDSVDEHTLKSATPYGVPWENVKLQEVTSDIIARNLRNAGIWTAEDLRKNQKVALGAVQAAYLITLGSLNQAANQFQKEGEK